MKAKIHQQGSVLLAIIIMLPFLILITALYMELSVSSLQLARRDQLQTHAQFAADAGVDQAMHEINENESWTGTGGEVELQPLTDSVRTTYEVTAANNGSDEKVVTAVGRSYQNSSTNPTSTITLEVKLRPVTSEFGVVSGVGGLVMSNSAKILGGDVYINGKITMSNTAQIGLSSSPVELNVAHQSCPSPPDATYPQICGSGNGEPITISNSAKIYGDVKANNQVDTTGLSSPGLTASSGVEAQPLPSHDRDAQKAAINAADASDSPDAISGSAASCSSGVKTWPANLKINGNVSISNSCKVTVEGNIWITGRLTMSNSSQLIASDSLGTTRANIMVDDEATFSNSSILKSNSSDIGFQIITYKSDASCSPDCTDVTGTDLYDSQTDITIQLNNSSSGPNTIFYARWSKVKVSNSGQIGALVGQTVDISNSGTITFGTSTGVGTKFWVIDSYQRTF